MNLKWRSTDHAQKTTRWKLPQRPKWPLKEDAPFSRTARRRPHHYSANIGRDDFVRCRNNGLKIKVLPVPWINATGHPPPGNPFPIGKVILVEKAECG